MRTWILPLPLLLLTSALGAQTPPPHRRDHRAATQSSVAVGFPARVPTANSRRRLQPVTNFATVFQPRVLLYATANDVPDFSSDFSGNGVPLSNNTLPRNKYAIGIQTNGMDGGGCVAIDPTHPYNGCVQIVNSSGNPVTARIAREIWTFRISYIDPTNPSASEVDITNGGDYVLEYVQQTPGGHSCFTFYPCDTYGVNLDFLTGTVALSNPNCAMKLGPGYQATIFYQASPYNEGAAPAGAQEWYPSAIPATPTRLEQPGGVLFSQAYSLGLADNALSMAGGSFVNPSVDSPTGYPTAAPTIAGGSETITLTSYDCGVIPNVAFSIGREFIPGTGGHAHSGTPPLDAVSSLDSYSGTTDNTGHWSTTLHAGTIGATLNYTASTTNLLGQSFSAQPLLISTGFAQLVDPGVPAPSDDVRYTGNSSVTGLRHPSNHWGAPELHSFVRNVAAFYNTDADPADQGSLGLNDMSIALGGVFDFQGTWVPPHFRHRFGTDCDIDRNVQRSDGSFTPIDTQVLQDSVDQLDGILLIESGGRLHVQVPEYQVGTILLRETQ